MAHTDHGSKANQIPGIALYNDPVFMTADIELVLS